MQKRVFIIHGWHGYPEEGWFPWLKKELEKNNFKVETPKMPNTDSPNIKSGTSFLSKLVKKTDESTYFVGHSIGCQTILRYLETLNPNTKIGGMILVAPWMTLNEATYKEEGEEGRKIAKLWIETPINFKKIKTMTNNIIAVFSDNDPYVPLENINIFEKELNATIILEQKKGHFSGDDNIKELSIALKKILTFTKK